MNTSTPARKQQVNRLGKGLAALLDDAAIPHHSDTCPMVDWASLIPSGHNPRQNFSHDSLIELAQSIRNKGLLQPIIVRHHPDHTGHYEILAGERRWRAAQLAEYTSIPIRLIEADDHDCLEIALIENIQRRDLSPLEEARGYQRFTEFGHTQNHVATLLGRSRAHIANMIRLLGLPKPVQDWLEEGKLSVGHARALITADDPVGGAEKIISGDLTVRAAEELLRRDNIKPRRKPDQPDDPSALPSAVADEVQWTEKLTDRLGLRVELVAGRRIGQGQIRIHYSSPQQLQALHDALAQAGKHR